MHTYKLLSSSVGDAHSQIDEAGFVQKGESGSFYLCSSGERDASQRDGSISPTSPQKFQFEGRQLDYPRIYESVLYQTTWPEECGYSRRRDDS